MEIQNIKEILDQIQVNLFVTDIKTHEIIFMNQKMKQAYGISEPEGKLCWKLLQKDQEGPCSFCKIPELVAQGEWGLVNWREDCQQIERIFDNYDSLIHWEDGRIVHLQQAIDITDTQALAMQSRLDELCGTLNRRGGKDRLSELLREAEQRDEPFVLGLLDVDNLKFVNDSFGHQEGDWLLEHMVAILKQYIEEPDFLFRLSGDEFVYVALHKSEKEVSRHLLSCIEMLGEHRRKNKKPYDISFSYGLYTVHPQDGQSVNDIIAKADEMMYMQKLRRRKTRLLESSENSYQHSEKLTRGFEYDSSLLYDALIKSTDDYIYICNMKTGIFRYSPAQVYLFDLPGEIMENPLPFWKKIVHPDDWERFYKSNMEIGENQMDYHSVEFRAKNRNGEYLWLRCRGQLMRDEYGDPVIFAGIMTQLGRQNKIDPVTQLLNYYEFIRVFERKLGDSMIERLGILVLDIDDFKQVNEMYNRDFGDYILKTVAQSTQSILPDNASLFKLDNDRMGILIENVTKKEVKELYSSIRAMLSKMQMQKECKLTIEVSGGCAMYPENGDTVTDLYKYADYSLSYAKQQGKKRLVFFSKEILENRLHTLELLHKLRESIHDNFDGFSLRFQPQVHAMTKEITGVEALLRWQDSQESFVSPLEFIPVLEKNGMIHQVGEWVLRMGMREAMKWVEQNPNFTLSVNVSAIQLLEPSFVEQVIQIVEEEGFPYSNLILELTESHAVLNMEFLSHKFKALRKMGIQIAMDDFGTGYSSLEVLKFSPIDVVKIDRVFVKDILNSKFDATFIYFVVAICHDVGIKVCLEGVETMEEYSALSDMKLDYIQGYLFGKPQTASEISGGYLN